MDWYRLCLNDSGIHHCTGKITNELLVGNLPGRLNDWFIALFLVNHVTQLFRRLLFLFFFLLSFFYDYFLSFFLSWFYCRNIDQMEQTTQTWKIVTDVWPWIEFHLTWIFTTNFKLLTWLILIDFPAKKKKKRLPPRLDQPSINHHHDHHKPPLARSSSWKTCCGWPRPWQSSAF